MIHPGAIFLVRDAHERIDAIQGLESLRGEHDEGANGIRCDAGAALHVPKPRPDRNPVGQKAAALHPAFEATSKGRDRSEVRTVDLEMGALSIDHLLGLHIEEVNWLNVLQLHHSDVGGHHARKTTCITGCQIHTTDAHGTRRDFTANLQVRDADRPRPLPDTFEATPHVFLPIEVAINSELGTTGDMDEVWIQARRYAGLGVVPDHKWSHHLVRDVSLWHRVHLERAVGVLEVPWPHGPLLCHIAMSSHGRGIAGHSGHVAVIAQFHHVFVIVLLPYLHLDGLVATIPHLWSSHMGLHASHANSGHLNA
mmetsp:Transcript_49592/g.116557  ORF Transcript_49592/g.116557 Transcript_49592/m.116557 type:complete len:310 (-) Transcript_49592:356-1285(-)